MSALDDAEREQTAKKRAEASDGEHGKLCIALTDWLGQRGIRINAVDHWYRRGTQEASIITVDRIAQDFVLEYRHRSKITLTYVLETLEALAAQWYLKARDERIRQLIGKPSTSEGMQTLHAWMQAVMGRVALPHEIAVMRHWLWLCKRAMASLPIEHHIMPVFVGPQGGGKTVAVTRVVSPLAELAMVPCAAGLVNDERWRPSLAKYVVGFWDELDGLDKSDRAGIKQVLTAGYLPYRPMRTNRTEQVPVITKFVGAANTPVAALFRDPTGSRRFYQLEAAGRLAWDVINRLDYVTLWTCVHEDDQAPLIPHLEAIQGEQETQRFRDSVGAWLQDETWGPIYYGNDQFAKVDPAKSIACTEAYERYRVWCQGHHEDRPLANTQFGARMAEEGFQRKRSPKDATGKRSWYYQRPEPTCPDVPACPKDSSLGKSSQEPYSANEAEPGQAGTPGQTIAGQSLLNSEDDDGVPF